MTLALLPYQHTGADFLAGKERGGLFDDMGVGKTAQAIGALDRCGAKRIIVVCPAAVREVWRGEFKKFSTVPRRILKGRSVDDLGLFLRGRVDVLLLSYEMAVNWAPRLTGEFIDVLVLDESHYLKNGDVARTRALLGKECDGKGGLAAWALRTWWLSGTPIPNDPLDIWTFLRFCRATPLARQTFKNRYFRSRPRAFSSSQEPLEKMVPELRQAIKSCSLRRTKEQAGLQLPPIWLTTQTVDGDTAEIRALMADYPDLEDAILRAVEQGGLSFLDAQHIATLRRLVGEAKAPAFIELLLQELQNGLEKVVVFGLHRRALAIIRDGLDRAGIEAVQLDGSTSERDRAKAVSRFQQAGGPRVFLGNIKAAGTGITLTAASDLIMFESDWSPAGNAQAIMRVHRISQTKTVRARFISLARSIDVVVNETVARKTAAIAKMGFEMTGTAQ